MGNGEGERGMEKTETLSLQLERIHETSGAPFPSRSCNHEAKIICFSRDSRESACKLAFQIHDILHCVRFEIKLGN